MDDRQFDALMTVIGKLDARSDRMETKMEKMDDRLRNMEITTAELGTKFDTQFPQIQQRLDQHVSQDTGYFKEIDDKITPLSDQQKRWSKEIWLHRVVIGVLVVAIGSAAPQALVSAIQFVAGIVK